MVAIPANVMALLNAHDCVKIFVTADKTGQPHAVAAGSIAAPAPDTVIIGEILMKQSVKNVEANKKAAFLVVKGLEAYEVNVVPKVRLDKGPEVDAMNQALAALHLHANAVWVFSVVSVFEQGANGKAGTKLA